MPVELSRICDGDLCHGYTWTITDRELLAKWIAWLVLGHWTRIAKIITGGSATSPTVSSAAAARAMAQLSTPKESELRWHRDGWVFQMISWVAAYKASDADTIIRQPHPQPTRQGFDGLMVCLHPYEGSVIRVTVCEDKATDNDRRTIYEEVWPNIAELENGNRDSELVNEVSSLLRVRPMEDVSELVDRVMWREQLSHRICITIKSKRNTQRGWKSLFKGYDYYVTGDTERRRAETVVLDDLRAWMDGFCALVRQEIKRLEGSKGIV